MAKYRIWAECISDVYLDVEADSEEEALILSILVGIFSSIRLLPMLPEPMCHNIVAS